MQFTLSLNLLRSREWGLSLPQATLFAFLYELPSWATSYFLDGEEEPYWSISKSKLAAELPLVSDKPDTIYRHLVVLESKGLIEKIVQGNKTYVKLTKQGKLWNRKGSDLNPTLGEGSDLNPRRVGFKSEKGRKIIRPINNTNINNTNINTPPPTEDIFSGQPEHRKYRFKIATPVPKDMKLNSVMVAYAEKKGLTGDGLEHQFEKFTNHHSARNSKMADWEAAWRTWVLNWVQFSKQNKGYGDVTSNETKSRLQSADDVLGRD